MEEEINTHTQMPKSKVGLKILTDLQIVWKFTGLFIFNTTIAISVLVFKLTDLEN